MVAPISSIVRHSAGRIVRASRSRRMRGNLGRTHCSAYDVGARVDRRTARRRRFMRGNAQVIAQLNQALKEELTAINQYFLHAEMCHNWGYHGLGDFIKKQSIDEMKHAEELIERLLFLDATPKMEYMELSVGSNVKQQ